MNPTAKDSFREVIENTLADSFRLGFATQTASQITDQILAELTGRLPKEKRGRLGGDHPSNHRFISREELGYNQALKNTKSRLGIE